MRKLFSVVLVLLVCFTTVFAGCTSEDTTPKSAEKHYVKTVWVYDNDCHWQECGDDDCGLVVNINNYYAQKEYVEKLTNEGWLPLRANTPDKYAKVLIEYHEDKEEYRFNNFAEYLAFFNEGKAPHLHNKEVKDADGNVIAHKCICGHVKGV